MNAVGTATTSTPSRVDEPSVAMAAANDAPAPAQSNSVPAPATDTLERTALPADKLAMLATIVERAKSPKRSQIALEMFTTLPLTNDLAKHAGVLVWAAGTTRDLPDTEGLVPPSNGFL